MTKETLIQWLDEHQHSNEWLAEKCDVKLRTVQSWRSNRPIPAKAVLIIENLMQIDQAKVDAASVIPQNLVLEFSKEQFDTVCEAASLDGKIPRQWVQDTINGIANENVAELAEKLSSYSSFKEINKSEKEDINDPNNITYFEIPCMGVVAGGTTDFYEENEARLTEDLGKGHLAMKVCGDSMEPKIKDGSTILVKKPEILNNPYMKKGLIYAVQVGNQCTLKVYNTRPATEEEIAEEAEYIYTIKGYQRVKVLESINPKYPEIILQEETKMIGWYDPSIQHLVAQ